MKANDKSELDYGRLKNRTHQINHRAFIDGLEGQIKVSDIIFLFNIQKGRCRWCQEDINSGFHVDHVIAGKHHGENTLENICLACPSCNHRKGSMQLSQWFMTLGSWGIAHPDAPLGTPVQLTLDDALASIVKAAKAA